MQNKKINKPQKIGLTIEVEDGNLTKLSDRPADATEKILKKDEKSS